jgi:hypothetical protein
MTRPPRGLGERGHLQSHGRIRQIAKDDQGSGTRAHTLGQLASRLDPDPWSRIDAPIQALGPPVSWLKVGDQRLAQGHVEMHWTGVRAACPDG